MAHHNEAVLRIKLSVEKHRDPNGWFFIKSDDVPGLFLFGPDLDELLADLPEAIAALRQAQAEFELATVRDLLMEQLTRQPEIENNWSIGQAEIKIPAHVAKAALA